LVSLAAFLATGAVAAPAGKKYSSPEKAVDAFVASVRNYDLQKLVAIFGPDSERLFVSEDEVADENIRTDFLKLYDAKHALRPNDDGSRTLIAGPDDWPFPIPLVKAGRSWGFDTDAGADEIVDRRIGRNELSAIQTCLAIVDAQREYVRVDRDGDGILEYAQTFRSTLGMRNGLFWPVNTGDSPSPLGVWVAAAADEGYSVISDNFHGYRFRMLSSQTRTEPGSTYSYLVRNDQIGGYASVAYPAAYGESGIMSFLVSHEGVVYQRDLGEKTYEEAMRLTSFNPEGWTQVEPKDTEPLPEPAP
jgi:hypothetical protein